MNKQLFRYTKPFELECGEQLPALEIVYHTYGKLNADKSNVVWVCHALTANSDCGDWWKSIIGNGKILDPETYFIICANIIGSCYGTTGPLSVNPLTGNTYYGAFPMVTIRDMVNAHILLRTALGINTINIGIAGSMGAYQLMEWAYIEKQLFTNLVMLSTSARESAWGIAIHTAQRLAIAADCTWNTPNANAGINGLKAARAIGMLTYRNYDAFGKTQTDTDNKIDNFKASSYINYQGDKLAQRFNAYSYWILSKSMDSHNTARNRGTMEEVLKQITSKALLIGIASDILCPAIEQQYLAQHLANAIYREIDSPYGHDGFLIEGEKVSSLLKNFLQQ